jgi:hypothetical protein
MPPARRTGDPLWSTLAGAGAGAVGGAVALMATTYARVPGAIHVELKAAAIVVLVGAASGAAFGRLTRRLVRVLPRLAFGAVIASTSWLLLYAFVLTRLAPGFTAAIPFGSSILGALGFGLCIGAVPPMRLRDERGRRL